MEKVGLSNLIALVHLILWLDITWHLELLAMAPCHCEGIKASRAEKKQGGRGVLYILLRLQLGWEMKIMGYQIQESSYVIWACTTYPSCNRVPGYVGPKEQLLSRISG